MPGRPPLDLSPEVTLADGTRYRWDSGASAAQDRAQHIVFHTKRGEGFADSTLTLSRRIDRDYVDLNLFDDFALVGYDGSIAYEGRVAANPRSLDPSGHQMSLQLVGWMAHAKDRKFQEIYVDRDMSGWQNAGLVGQASQSASFADMSWSADAGGLICSLPGTLGAQASMAEAWYVAPAGVQIAKVMYVGQESNMPGTWEVPQLAGGTGEGSHAEVVAATFDNTLRTATLAALRAAVMWRVYNNALAATPAQPAYRKLNAVGVYSSHGLTTRSIDAATPNGLYASDVLADIVSRFCPKLSTAGIQATTYPIPHLVFKDRTFPYDAFLQINKFHLWDFAVWENKTFTYRPYDLTDYDWEVRLSDPGVTVQLQGDSTDQLANGIVVQYVDVATGRTAVLTPDTTAALADPSVTNPATTHGLKAWTELVLTDPTTAAAATAIGTIALAEFNQAKGPGTITVTGHIRDRAGHWQQGWKVRAGDTVAITDHPNDRPRLIVETAWDHDQKQLTIAVDSTIQRLEAVLDRVSNALQAANLH